MSPTAEKTIVEDELPSSPSDEKGYFDLPRQKPQISGGTLFSGDEADTDGENDRGPQVRDFETEHIGSSRTSAIVKPRRKQKKSKRKKSSKHDKHLESGEKQVSIEDAPLSLSQSELQHQPRVGFKGEPENEIMSNGSPRKGFTRQMSRPSFRPSPFPSLLSNTVFNNPPPPKTPGQSQPAPFSIAHRSVALRRTSSLPDRLNRPTATRMPSGVPPNSNGGSEVPQRSSHVAPNAPEVKAEDDKDDGNEKPGMSRTAAVVLLLATTALVAFCAELAVDAIPDMVADTSVSLAFIGLIVLPIVGNAAEHVTAVTVAAKNKMDLAIGVAVGSSIQIALFVTPVVVLLGWILNKEMSLYFNLFETVSLFVTAFVVNFLVLDGRSNYLEGSLLIAAYVIIAVAAFFYPNQDDQSQLGGGS